MIDLERLAREAGIPASLSAHPGVKQLARLVQHAVAEEIAKFCEPKHPWADYQGSTGSEAMYRTQSMMAESIRSAFGLDATSEKR